MVNFSGSTVWKVLLFVCASAFYDKAVPRNNRCHRTRYKLCWTSLDYSCTCGDSLPGGQLRGNLRCIWYRGVDREYCLEVRRPQERLLMKNGNLYILFVAPVWDKYDWSHFSVSGLKFRISHKKNNNMGMSMTLKVANLSIITTPACRPRSATSIHPLCMESIAVVVLWKLL